MILSMKNLKLNIDILLFFFIFLIMTCNYRTDIANNIKLEIVLTHKKLNQFYFIQIIKVLI